MNGRVVSTYSANTVTGANSGIHGNCSGNAVAINPASVKLVAAIIVGLVTVRAAGCVDRMSQH